MGDHLWIKDEGKVLTTYPPKYAWECARCGAVVTTEGGMPSTDGCAAHASIELLRKWVRSTRADGLGPLGTSLKELEEIADMVEAELEAEREESAFWEAEHDVELNKRINAEQRTADMERTHMKLPVDADGVPIRPGDIMRFRNDAPVRVDSIGNSRCYEGDYGWFGGNGGFYGNGTLSECRHVKPDTLESLLAGMVKDIASEHVIYVPDDKKDEFGARLRDIRDDYAERIRKAVDNGD